MRQHGGIFRIIHSVPSPKAEPFKRWLAKVGYERIQEIEDPELGTKQTKEITGPKGILKTGLNAACGASPYEPNSRMNERNAVSKKMLNIRF